MAAIHSIIDVAQKSSSTPLPKIKNTNVEKQSNQSTQTTVREQLPDSVSQDLKSAEEHDKPASESKLLVARDFFWDEWLSYIATAILALALIDISVEFLVGSSLGVLCFAPFLNDTSQDFDRDQSAFINSWCSRQLPYTEFYPLFTLVQGVVLLVPHYVWLSIFSSNFNFYFSLVSALVRLRDRNTGEYVPQNSAIIRKLEDEFEDKRTMLVFYYVKLFAQLAIYIVIVAITFALFKDFTPDITCPPLSMEESQIFGRVQCTYARFRFLRLLQIVNVILLVIGILIVILGLFMVLVYGYFQVTRYNYIKLAKFTYYSALNPSYFVANRRKFSSLTNDMDFMLLKLFSVDTGYAKLLRDIRSSDYVRTLQEAAYQRLHTYMYRRKHHTISEDLKLNRDTSHSEPNPIDDYIQAKSSEIHDNSSDCNTRAVLDLSFVPHNYAFIMARYFEKVGVIHFDDHYQNSSRIVMSDHYSNITAIRAPVNILALPFEQQNKLTGLIRNKFLEWEKKKQSTHFKIHFIVINGIDSQFKSALVSQVIETVSTLEYVEIGATLLVFTPDRIEGKRLRGFFEPTLQSRFWKPVHVDSQENHSPNLHPTNKLCMCCRTNRVSPSEFDNQSQCHSIEDFSCGGTKCSFKCALYKYSPDTP